MDDNGRNIGTVQWFSRVKGYGFIRPEGREEDVFVHYSAIRGDGYRNLNEGQKVEFTMEDTPKGPQAVDVLGLETPEGEPEVYEQPADEQPADEQPAFEQETFEPETYGSEAYAE